MARREGGHLFQSFFGGGVSYPFPGAGQILHFGSSQSEGQIRLAHTGSLPEAFHSVQVWVRAKAWLGVRVRLWVKHLSQRTPKSQPLNPSLLLFTPGVWWRPDERLFSSCFSPIYTLSHPESVGFPSHGYPPSVPNPPRFSR